MVISDLGSEKYLAQYEMTEFDTEGQIEFEILVTDTVGINSEPITETTNSSLVVFDKTLPILDQVNIQSNNENNNSIAITGDDVILTFTPEEPLLPDSIIATIANEYASIAKPYNVKILDTRKTTPGLRLFEKYAIAIGGAFNHRLNLSEGILISLDL